MSEDSVKRSDLDLFEGFMNREQAEVELARGVKARLTQRRFLAAWERWKQEAPPPLPRDGEDLEC